MEGGSNATESQNPISNIETQGACTSKSTAKPPPGPVRWKPSPRKRKRATKARAIPPKEQNEQGAGIGIKKTSWVWDHFETTGENEDRKAFCKYCGHEYATHSKVHGTTNLRNHLLHQCKKYPYRLVDEKQKTIAFEIKQEGNSDLGVSFKTAS
ncbi:hypothetical protein RD792_005969 [Penstemon davidsonii]|uniref:BED-type domain-containing protein n=1 Tax=Penstemon davidsonii TaxID=160366 RepID=A0ABR0DDW2_9LAMI|nr:hypothetical protein RD792_005969 [Penstemon davidsonii]